MAAKDLHLSGRECKVCGELYYSRVPGKSTCSVACAKEMDRNRSREYQRARRADLPSAEPVFSECCICGKKFQRTNRRHKVCSRPCRNKSIAASRPSRAEAEFPDRQCLRCGATFQPRSYQNNYCTEQCRASYKVRLNKERRVPKRDPNVSLSCAECGTTFTPRDARQYLCSVACNLKVNHRIGSRTRRARLAGVECEPIDPIKVFERDGYRCGLCGKRTLKAKRGTIHPRAPELDHIVAISLGGSHTYANVQCSCRECNRRKGAAAIGQMHLFPAQ